MKIGFFDSGLGGLTILKSVARELPQYDYEFYGDTANLPYGDKTEEEVYALTKKGIEHLIARNCSLTIVACNTASSMTLRKLQDGFLKDHHEGRKVLGVIIPTVEEVIDARLKNVLLLGTKKTIDSGKYEKEFSKHEMAPKLVAVATPKLVPLIEEGDLNKATELAIEVIDQVGEEIEGVILGCTHYSLLTPKLSEYFKSKNIIFFSQDKIIPKKVKAYLSNHPEIEQQLSQTGERVIHLTNNSSRYDTIIQELLGGSLIGD